MTISARKQSLAIKQLSDLIECALITITHKQPCLQKGERQIYRQAMLMAEAQQEGEHVMAQTYRKRMDIAYSEALADCGADLIFDIGQVLLSYSVCCQQRHYS